MSGTATRVDDCPLSAARLIQLSLIAIACAAATAALVGLPLFGDGAYYYFKLAVDGEPVLPNLRYAALLAQLPAWVAARLGVDALLLRHLFAFGYAALPVLSLLVCWLAVRPDAPALILFPVLSLLANQINFSGVSELMASLYLSWPLLLLMALAPARVSACASVDASLSLAGRRRAPASLLGRTGAWRRLDAIQLYALCTGPLLLLLHPLAFVPGLLLALLALMLSLLPAEADPSGRRVWRGIAVWMAVCAMLRLGWTLIGTNAYERSNLQGESALNYLLASTPLQHLLLALIGLLGIAFAVSMIVRQRRPSPLSPLLLRIGVLALLLLSIAVGAEFLAGQGIKLKAALTFVVGLALMVLAAIVGLVGARPARADQPADMSASGSRQAGHEQTQPQPAAADTARLFALCALAVVLIMLAKSSAWWTATRGLQDVVVGSEGACVEFGPQQPFGLQWPWMAIVDDWATPMTALAFRPRAEVPWPIPLLLPYDGCRVLEETGVAHLTTWLERPWMDLQAAFGPLRPIEFQSQRVYPASLNFAPSFGD
jgi:hypothetical protein